MLDAKKANVVCGSFVAENVVAPTPDYDFLELHPNGSPC
jgi:hypothetical protein